MAPIAWDATLQTGDAAVDQQHRAIHALFNELESSADDAAAVMRALEFLTEHVLVHFATEEALMARSGYSAALTKAHIAEHALLTESVRANVLAFRAGELDSVRPLVDLLRDWLTKHVHQCDRELVTFVNGRGIYGELTPAWFAAEQALAGA